MKLFNGVVLITGTSFLMFSAFAVTFVGFLLGRITIKGINLGSAGVFILALLYGALFSDHISSTVSQKVDGKNVDISTNALDIIEKIGLILFIGAVGHISGPTFFYNFKKNFKSYIAVGALIILTAALSLVACFYIGKKYENDRNEFVVMMVGIFSGALTSTPAFSAAKSTAKKEYESAATVGYAIAYIFGVVGVVFFVQLMPKILGANMDVEREILLAESIKNKKSNDNKKEEKKEEKEEKKTHNKSLKSEEIKCTDKERENEKQDIQIEELEIEIPSTKVESSNISSYNRKNGTKQVINGAEKISKISNEVAVIREENEEEPEKVELKEETKKTDEATFKLDPEGYCIFSLSAVIGIFFGAIRIPLSNKGLNGTTFSFTTTGGVLIISLVIAHFGKIKKLSLKIEKGVLETLRELGLVLFLTGSGLSGGAKFVEYFKVIYFVYGIFITTLPMVAGFFFSKYVLKLNLLNNLGAITGGMTSTPALGILISSSGTDEVTGSYAATYPIALICVVLCAQLIILLL